MPKKSKFIVSMAESLVSIVMPVYNAGKYLRASVCSVLDQMYPNLEILIIDDGSTDGCMNFIADLKDPRIRLFGQENRGKAVVLNQALEELSGQFYAIQDADDISYPERIARQVRCLLENPDVAAVFTGHDIILDGRRLAPRFAAKSVEQCKQDIEQMRMPAHDPTGMFRMSMVSDLRYEPTLSVGQGWDYILRVGERYPIMVLGECLYSYRVHSNSITRQDWARTKQKIRDVKDLAYRRRSLSLNKYPCLKSGSSPNLRHREKEIGIVPHFMESVLDLRRAGRNRQAFSTALACLWLHPFDPYYYKPLVYFFMPLVMIRYYRSRKRG